MHEGKQLEDLVDRSGLNREEFAKKMRPKGYSSRYLGKLFKKETLKPIYKEQAAAVVKYLSPNPLLSIVAEPEGKYVTTKNPQGIPVYDIVSLAGKGSSETQLTGNISHYINIPGYEDCIGIPAYGLSMYPLLDSGGIGICKHQQDKNHIMYGQVYSIDYKGTQFYKFLQKSTDKTKLLCISLNHDPTRPDCNFEPFEINRDEIDALYLLRLAVNKH